MIKKTTLFYITLAVIFLLSVVLSLTLGAASLSLKEIYFGLLRRDGYESAEIIVRSIRLPRLLAAIVAGAGLGVAGVILQSVMSNELASPNTVGVNAGAGLAVIIALSISPTLVKALPLAAFLGAFFTLLIILAVSRSLGGGKSYVILAGIACTTFFQAVISFFSIIDTDVLSMYNSFSVGSFSGTTYDKLIIPSVLVIFSITAAVIMSPAIASLSLGDRVASGLGVRVKTVRTISLAIAGLCAASVISYAGLLGFVGLVVPHITRRIAGNEPRRVLIVSPVIGAILVTLSDLAGRMIFAPTEIPVGIVMAFIGAPFFFILLLKRRKGDA